ncbi:MAG: DinB family protein [Gemmatimonadota bacterium]|nr:MAG: DinB family protein [Gemmatimonadota bacterium]
MIAELLNTFESTLTFLERSVADLSEEEMVRQPPGVPNHATWTLGHVIWSCQGMAGELGVDEWLPDDWTSLFGTGSTPTSVASRYPKKTELLTMLTAAADRLRDVLLAADESALGQPLPDVQVREILPTLGHAFLQVLAAHTAFHAGQLAVWRAAIGANPVAVFV